MTVIPVIDLQGGAVVHAHLGQRQHYRPIETPLCPGSNPFSIVQAFLRLHPFSTIYLADLDALTGKVPQSDLIGALAAAFPAVRFWVDAGWPAPVGDWTPVVGTESLDCRQWRELSLEGRDWVLSLDHFDGQFVGPGEILSHLDLWPQQTLVMCLNRVGSSQGPDFDRLRHLRTLAPDLWLAAAGGVRGSGDLESLKKIGIDGALVASALHDGRLVTFE
ncbi:HisA/HisF-related TIM barrel protein [Methyloterricola oryzae]|uniref:HisA/HisF-related TIM barrel protein n=1 Tax=Methyloterricola oryzae TaxID=1495050 RepID=UPI0005EAEAE5|nr:HisA/HisF-related TIM barrel protein [Methyloterricola oryzae]